MLHQQVLLLHLLRRRVLRRRDLVADHLEDVRIRRQRENRHHQPLDAGRDDEVIGRVLEVMEKIAEEQRLSLLLQADHRVELGFGAHRHHAAQERDVRRGHLHVDQKICPVGREQERDLLGIHEQRVDIEPAIRIVSDRHHERVDVKAIDDAADDVGGAVSEEERRENLDLVIGLEHERPRQARPERPQ